MYMQLKWKVALLKIYVKVLKVVVLNHACLVCYLIHNQLFM